MDRREDGSPVQKADSDGFGASACERKLKLVKSHGFIMSHIV